MDRTYQGKIPSAMFVVLCVMIGLTFCMAWYKNIIGVGFCAMLIFLIDCLLHTTFTVTAKNEVIIREGRFFKEKRINVGNIARIERRFVRMGFFSYLALILNNGDEIMVWPSDEQGFTDYILNKRDRLNKHKE